MRSGRLWPGMHTMDLLKWFRKAQPTPRRNRDRIIDLLNQWSSRTVPINWVTNRIEAVGHFTGWPYVAIKSICEEVATNTPIVKRKVDGTQSKLAMAKSLSVATSHLERDAIRQAYRRKTMSRAMRRKALIHLQESDELEAISGQHPLVQLFQNPNGPDVAYSFFYKLFMFLELCGASYIWCVPSQAGTPCQLWVIPAHWVRECPGDKELIGEYEIRPTASPSAYDQLFGSGWFPGIGGISRIPADQIIRIAYPSPLSIIDGHSPLVALSRWVDVSKAISDSRVQTLVNGAFPGVILQLDKESEDLDEPDLERVVARFAEKAAGVRNSRKPIVLAPGMTLVPSPWGTSVELDHVNSETQSRDQILAGYRVGPTVAGITEQTSFAADDAARASFYQGALRPKLVFIGQVLTEKLASRFGDDLVVYWKIPTPDDQEFLLKKVDTLSRLMAITPNEIREEFGLDSWEYGGDDPMAPMGQQPLSWATGEDHAMNQMGMMGGDPSQQGEQGGDPLESVMQELLGGDAGGDGASEKPAGGIPTPLAKRLNGKAVANGKH